MASSKRQTTMAKIAREQAVREKRARKAEKKEDKKQAAAEALLAPVGESEDGEAPDEDSSPEAVTESGEDESPANVDVA
jgi:hypothetical protein